MLQNHDPKVRLAGIAQAGRTRDESALAFLVDRLSDSQENVRFFALQVLKDLTGQTLGYRPYEPVEKRQAAIDRWRGWLSQRSETPATTQTAGEKP